jgi:hypothetical protein
VDDAVLREAYRGRFGNAAAGENDSHCAVFVVSNDRYTKEIAENRVYGPLVEAPRVRLRICGRNLRVDITVQKSRFG